MPSVVAVAAVPFEGGVDFVVRDVAIVVAVVLVLVLVGYASDNTVGRRESCDDVDTVVVMVGTVTMTIFEFSWQLLVS